MLLEQVKKLKRFEINETTTIFKTTRIVNLFPC